MDLNEITRVLVALVVAVYAVPVVATGSSLLLVVAVVVPVGVLQSAAVHILKRPVLSLHVKVPTMHGIAVPVDVA